MNERLQSLADFAKEMMVISEYGSMEYRLAEAALYYVSGYNISAVTQSDVAQATATPQDSTSPATSPQSAATAAIRPPTNTTPTPVSADARSHKAPTKEE